MPDNIVTTYDETDEGVSYKYYEVGGLFVAFEKIKQHKEKYHESLGLGKDTTSHGFRIAGQIEMLNKLINH